MPRVRRRTIVPGAAALGTLVAASLAIPSSAQTPPASPSAAAVVVAAEQIVDAGEPTLSADGRWIVFGGEVDGRPSVFRTDRTDGRTIELSSLPPGVRDGATVHPRVSADGCVVVAITEIPYDLFRDDDRGERWDVYRLVVPECGGQVNGWELVSADARSGTARDDVFTWSAPSLSGSGAQIAYVHQAPEAPEGVATITIVDVTVSLGEEGREQQVAGMPVEAPGGAFKYRGARDPALSQNGRHLAFVSDTTASEALPGWGQGPVPGELATSQVYVWDRGWPDQRRAVRLVSGRGGVPSLAGAGEPAVSEDGRIVVFTSRDRTLVPGQLECGQECPSQVYRFDRDTDGNGVFDEPARRPDLALVSAVDAGVVEQGVPMAGNASSWAPAVNADGSQIAFVTDAGNLLPSRRGGGGGPFDGDLLVAEFHLGQIRRVLDGSDATGVPGAHGRPALSRTGQVLAFDTMAARVIPSAASIGARSGRAVMALEFVPQLSLAALDFGTVLLGFESTELFATVQNAGPAAFEPTDVRSSSANFRITGGSCSRGIIVAAGQSCSVRLTFSPSAPRGFAAELTVSGDGPGSPSVTAVLHGSAGEPALLATPGGVDLADGVVGQAADRVAIDVGNIGFIPVSVRSLTIGGANPDDFRIVSEACTGGRALNPDASCAVEIEFVPGGSGYRSALLIATANNGAYTTAVLGGFGEYDPSFLRDEASPALQGGTIGLGGSGFPANVTVAIGFEGGGAPFATVDTNESGTFLTRVTLPARIRVGPRTLTASAPGGVAAQLDLVVEGRRRADTTVLPGFGLG
jgi:Tol biopolymer transport system component